MSKILRIIIIIQCINDTLYNKLIYTQCIIIIQLLTELVINIIYYGMFPKKT